LVRRGDSMITEDRDARLAEMSQRLGGGGAYRLTGNDVRWLIAEVIAGDTRISALEAQIARLHTLRPEGDYHEDMGPVLWWIWPICEPPYCGQPGDSDWPDYHTHFSPLPNCAGLSVQDSPTHD
jgi:hypothetical protein